jgi:membrane peptidoglycan carboxypeptidase
MLEGVVQEGTGRRAAIEGYSVAGKTGTAQKAVPGRGYSATRFVASFVGFAPARNPKVVAIVAIDEPQTSTHGGSVAAPAFKNIVERILLYKGVMPEREPSVGVEGLELARHPLTDDEEGDVPAIDSDPESGDDPSMTTVAGAA